VYVDHLVQLCGPTAHVQDRSNGASGQRNSSGDGRHRFYAGNGSSTVENGRKHGGAVSIAFVRSWKVRNGTCALTVDRVGEVLFCYATPRNDTVIFTRRTLESRLLPVFEGVNVGLVVCGHTHMQFDRMVGRTRIVNAGSVGMPFGEPGAYWLLVGPDVELRRTSYDLTRAAARVRETDYPQADEFATQSILQPPSEQQMLVAYSRVELR
jgi:hypothetical protein